MNEKCISQKNLRLFTSMILVLVFSSTLHAAYPTMEGLFRNPNNKDLEGNVVVVSLTIDPVESRLEAKEGLSEVDSQGQKSTLPIIIQRKIKLIFSLEKRDEIELLQVEYSDPEMADKSLLSTMYIPNLLNKIETDEYLERSLFYSLMAMFSLNDSRGISNLISKYNPGYKSNKGAMNEEKVKLLEKYRQYLLTAKEGEQENPEQKSPLLPEDEAEKSKAAEILKSNMYGKPDALRMARENGKFYWRLTLDKIDAFFTNEFHHLKKLHWNLDNGSIQANIGEYVLLDGIHEVPKFILYHEANGRIFKISFVKLLAFYNKGNSLSKRAKSYDDLLKIRKGKKSSKGSSGQQSLGGQSAIFLY